VDDESLDMKVLEAKPVYLEGLGLVKGYRCPRCNGELELHHVDDAGTKWFICKQCGQYSNKPKSEERKRLEEALKPVFLLHLNMIEDPNLAGRRVVVEAIVASTSIAYLVPSEVEARFEDKEGEIHYKRRSINEEDPVNIKLVGVNEDVKQRRLRRLLGLGRNAVIEENEWRTVYMVRVRPPVFTLEKRGERIVDERGCEYKAYDIYITSEKPIVFQPSSIIRLEGLCVPNPKTQKTTLLAYKVEFPEEIQRFDVEKLNKLKTKFQGWSVEDRLKWILDNFELFSQIVGRRNLALAGLLCLFTPTWVKINREIQRGWGNVIFIGDTTTAKSETVRKLIMLLKAGMLITAETASTVGLVGTATQVEKEGWFVDWGFLVLCDRKFLAVDGAHKLSLSNWAALAEAERSGVVTIAKAAKNSAYARTRQIKIANPVDKGADKYSTKTLKSFLYPCQALTTVLDKTSIARLDLAVFSDSRDVNPEEINRESSREYDRDLELLREAIRWCWSDVAEVKFTKEAVKRLLKEATELYNIFFCDSIPLCSIDMKWKLARLSTALAYLTMSTEDFSRVTVTEDHVKIVVKFLREEYSKAGLNSLAQTEKHEILTEEDADSIIGRIATEANLEREEIEAIIQFIVLQGRVTRDQIMTKFGLAERNQLRPLLAVLSGENMIRSGRGLYCEPKLIQLYKILTGKFAKVTKVAKLRKEGVKNSKENRESLGVNSDLGKLGNLGRSDTETTYAEPVSKGPIPLNGQTVTFEKPKKKVEGRGCYDCRNFNPADPERIKYGLAGECMVQHKWLMEPTIMLILKRGCDGFELRDDLKYMERDQYRGWSVGSMPHPPAKPEQSGG